MAAASRFSVIIVDKRGNTLGVLDSSKPQVFNEFVFTQSTDIQAIPDQHFAIRLQFHEDFDTGDAAGVKVVIACGHESSEAGDDGYSDLSNTQVWFIPKSELLVKHTFSAFKKWPSKETSRLRMPKPANWTERNRLQMQGIIAGQRWEEGFFANKGSIAVFIQRGDLSQNETERTIYSTDPPSRLRESAEDAGGVIRWDWFGPDDHMPDLYCFEFRNLGASHAEPPRSNNPNQARAAPPIHPTTPPRRGSRKSYGRTAGVHSFIDLFSPFNEICADEKDKNVQIDVSDDDSEAEEPSESESDSNSEDTCSESTVSEDEVDGADHESVGSDFIVDDDDDEEGQGKGRSGKRVRPRGSKQTPVSSKGQYAKQTTTCAASMYDDEPEYTKMDFEFDKKKAYEAVKKEKKQIVRPMKKEKTSHDHRLNSRKQKHTPNTPKPQLQKEIKKRSKVFKLSQSSPHSPRSSTKHADRKEKKREKRREHIDADAMDIDSPEENNDHLQNDPGWLQHKLDEGAVAARYASIAVTRYAAKKKQRGLEHDIEYLELQLKSGQIQAENAKLEQDLYIAKKKKKPEDLIYDVGLIKLRLACSEIESNNAEIEGKLYIAKKKTSEAKLKDDIKHIEIELLKVGCDIKAAKLRACKHEMDALPGSQASDQGFELQQALGELEAKQARLKTALYVATKKRGK